MFRSTGEVGKLERFIVARCALVGEPLCGLHHDCGSSSNTRCNNALHMGQRLTSEECRVRVKLWLLAGMTVAVDDLAGRHKHVHAVDPRRLGLMSELECDLQLERFSER